MLVNVAVVCSFEGVSGFADRAGSVILVLCSNYSDVVG